MKYEKIKKQVAMNLYTAIKTNLCCKDVYVILLENALSNKPKKPREALQDAADFAYDTVMNWDIRCIGKLRELFPEIFPKTLLKGHLILEYGEDGWEVFKK